MSLTIKQIIDNALNGGGLPSKTQYFGGSDFTITAVANDSALALTQNDYSLLRTEGTFTMTTATEYTLPTDLRYIVADTMQANDNERFVKFPTTDAQWYYLKARSSSSGIRFRMRIADGTLQVEEPQSGQVIIYEYLTSNTITTHKASAPDKDRFDADNDTWLLDDQLLVLDIRWRYKEQKGIEGWESDYQKWRKYNRTHRGREAGSGLLRMGAPVMDEYPEPYYNLWQ